MLAKNGVFALDNTEFIAGLKARQDKEKSVKLGKARKKKSIIQVYRKKLRHLARRMDTSPFITLKILNG